VKLFKVGLFYHPSGDHMDDRPYGKEEFFTLSTSFNEALKKVIAYIKSQRLGAPSHYKSDIACISTQGVAPEQALAVLEAAGLKVVK
jgi:hypothetical protein